MNQSCYFITIIVSWKSSHRIKRGNGEHIKDTTIQPEMNTATEGHPMVFNERQKNTPEGRLQLAPI